MRIQKVDNYIERNILIGSIVSDEFFKEIVQYLTDLKQFSRGAQIILRWCRSYYNKYGKVPKKQIQDIYIEHKDRLDEDIREYVEDLLTSLSQEYDYVVRNFNARYFIDKAIEFINKKKLQDVTEKVSIALENGKLEEAQKLLLSYEPIKAIEKQQLNPFESELYVEDVFKSVGKPVFKLPGFVGLVLNDQLYRASFIAFQGAEKVGKSWFLQEIAIQAMLQRKKVAIFEAGDMTKAQRLARIYSRLAKRPWVPGMNGGTKWVMSASIEPSLYEERKREAEERNCHVSRVLDPDDITFEMKKTRLLSTKLVRNRMEEWKKKYSNYLRISVHLSNTLTPRMMDQIIEDWAIKENFLPDVIIVDYADILTTDKTNLGSERRHYINEVWIDLRALSQKWQVVLLTATQADSASYKRQSQDLTNFSEDKRKYAHVTAMFALNRTTTERSLGVLRVQPLLVRESPPPIGNRQLMLVSDYSTANPWKYSFLVDSGYNFVATVPEVPDDEKLPDEDENVEEINDDELETKMNEEEGGS